MLYIYELASVPGATKRGVAKKKKNGIQGYASGQIMNNLESLGWRFDFDQYRFPLLLFYLVKRLKTKMYQKYFQSILEPN